MFPQFYVNQLLKKYSKSYEKIIEGTHAKNITQLRFMHELWFKIVEKIRFLQNDMILRARTEHNQKLLQAALNRKALS